MRNDVILASIPDQTDLQYLNQAVFGQTTTPAQPELTITGTAIAWLKNKFQ